jgi:hypothetical protein
MRRMKGLWFVFEDHLRGEPISVADALQGVDGRLFGPYLYEETANRDVLAGHYDDPPFTHSFEGVTFHAADLAAFTDAPSEKDLYAIAHTFESVDPERDLLEDAIRREARRAWPTMALPVEISRELFDAALARWTELDANAQPFMAELRQLPALVQQRIAAYYRTGEDRLRVQEYAEAYKRDGCTPGAGFWRSCEDDRLPRLHRIALAAAFAAYHANTEGAFPLQGAPFARMMLLMEHALAARSKIKPPLAVVVPDVRDAWSRAAFFGEEYAATPATLAASWDEDARMMEPVLIPRDRRRSQLTPVVIDVKDAELIARDLRNGIALSEWQVARASVERVSLQGDPLLSLAIDAVNGEDDLTNAEIAQPGAEYHFALREVVAGRAVWNDEALARDCALAIPTRGTQTLGTLLHYTDTSGFLLTDKGLALVPTRALSQAEAVA